MLKLVNICHYYKNKKNDKFLIFNNLNLNIKNNSFTSILGSSGCGKTTLVNMIAGYIKPVSGKVILKNKLITKPGRDRIIINQEDDLFQWLTVYENMHLITKNDYDIEKYLKMTNLYEYKHSYPGELSGGMKKRLSLARALAIHPDFIVMDEPFASLDKQTKENLHIELLKLFKHSKMTVLLVTHDIEEAIFLSERILLLGGNPTSVLNEFDTSFIQQRNESLKYSSQFNTIRLKINKYFNAKH